METQIGTQDQTTLTDFAPPTKKVEPVVFDSPHYYAITRVALALYADELRALAKKLTAEGRAREARTLVEDATAINDRIAPQLGAQRELPLVSDEQIEKAIAGALSVFVARAFDGIGDAKTKITKDGAERRRDRLTRELTERVRMFARDVAENAWHTGYQARMTTPDSLAYAQVQTLRSARAD